MMESVGEHEPVSGAGQLVDSGEYEASPVLYRYLLEAAGDSELVDALYHSERCAGLIRHLAAQEVHRTHFRHLHEPLYPVILIFLLSAGATAGDLPVILLSVRPMTVSDTTGSDSALAGIGRLPVTQASAGHRPPTGIFPPGENSAFP